MSSASLRRLGSVVHDLSWALRHAEPPTEGYDQLPPTEFQIMRFLDRHPESSVGEVARGLGLQQSNASTAVRGLIDRGLVDKRPDDDDRRVVRLTTTPLSAGRRAPVEASWGDTLERALAELGDDDAAAVRRAIAPLERLVAALD
ncbi:MarR family transcriptional regulator [Cellulomonas sp. NPDC089187]|uniref:MarR family transcriptional regulator n=1 Tax=Cellulomonas sp. NPDC089187 TaxID=3154970 RepID=UPI00343785B4